MRKINLLLAFLMAGAIGGDACAMERPAKRSPECSVSGADRLPADAGGADAICSAIREAARDKAPGADFTVEVRVESTASLAARVRLKDGRTLPEQKMAISDRGLNAGSIERFAAAIAASVAASEAP